MTNIFQSLLLVIAGATQKELARQIKYLKVENQILRSRLSKRLDVTPKERARLVKFAGKLAAKVLGQLATIVHPDTLLRWVREDRRGNRKQAPVWRGRPRTPEQLRRLIRKLARENPEVVRANLAARGFHLQFPPTVEDPMTSDWGTDA